MRLFSECCPIFKNVSYRLSILNFLANQTNLMFSPRKPQNVLFKMYCVSDTVNEFKIRKFFIKFFFSSLEFKRRQGSV